jgi:SHS2 domain-containing protein
MKRHFEILEHPADLGIEARGKNLAEAFQAAADGLMSLLVDPATVEPSETRHVEIRAADAGQLLVKWLGEILYLFDGEKFVSSKFAIFGWSDNALSAAVAGEKLNSSRHVTRMDVKAITYHQLQVVQNQGGGQVRVFLDI